MAKELSGDDKKAAESSNYRRAHHHLTVMYEAFMAERGAQEILSYIP